jgi:hypothetical protein
MGPNPCGTLNGLLAVIQKLLDNIYFEGERIIGNAFHEAKCEVIQQYFPTQYMYGPAYVYTLLGDPALRIKYPMTGAMEHNNAVVDRNLSRTLFINGPLLLPQGKKYRVFNISGQDVKIKDLRPGIYFVEIDGKISWKVIKIK